MYLKDNPRVAIVNGIRTPFVKAGTTFRKHSALDLSLHVVGSLLRRGVISSDWVSHMHFGIVVINPRIPQFSREVALRSDLSDSIRAVTVSDNCITGGTSMVEVYRALVEGRGNTGIAGGVESMSNPAILFNSKASRLFLELNRARSLGDKLKLASKFRFKDFVPDPPGVAEPSTGLSMGEHTELMVKEWGISREAQDEFAFASHKKANLATQSGFLPDEIEPVGNLGHDSLIRPETSMDKMAKLKPVFDRSDAGTITAATSSPLTDGAAALVLMTEEKLQAEKIEPLAFIKDFEFASLSPHDGLLMGPAIAVPRLLKRNNISLEDIDIIEMHEAFAGQILCNLAAFKKGWKEPAIGKVDTEKLNPLGSSIAVGHPFAATGIRIAITLANQLKRTSGKLGLISICGAGGTAFAMLLERD